MQTDLVKFRMHADVTSIQWRQSDKGIVKRAQPPHKSPVTYLHHPS